MNFDKLVKEINLDKELHDKFIELEDCKLGPTLKKVAKLKLYISEFLDDKDVENINLRKRITKNISYKDQRIEVKVSALGDSLCLSRKDSYRDQKEPFFKVSMLAVKSQVCFTLFKSKVTNFEESCYTFSYKGEKIARTEMFENGQRVLINNEQKSEVE